MKFEGIYTPAITPLGSDGEIDRKAFAAVLELLIAGGVHGIIIARLDRRILRPYPQERIDLAAYARKVIGTRLPLIVGTGAIRTEDSVAYARHAREIGADAILVASPPYAIPTEEENAVHALTIDRAAGLPIMLYNYPGRMGVSMGEDYFTRVGASRNVIAIKESSGDLDQLHMLARQLPEHRALLRLGRPGARVLRLGRAELGLCRLELPPRRACRALRGLRGGEGLRQGPADHVGDAAADGPSRRAGSSCRRSSTAAS